MARLGMVINLKKCIGCYACVVTCKAENGTPRGIFWNRILEREEGKYPSAKRMMIPVLCNHCQDAPCVDVCPSGATTQRNDGIVTVDKNKCIGCRYCLIACPYQNRTFVDKIRTYFEDSLTPYENLAYQKHEEGVVEKCTFCADRVDRGLKPACVQICPTSCRTFGDLEDPNSEVSLLLRARASFKLLPEADTKPAVYYLV